MPDKYFDLQEVGIDVRDPDEFRSPLVYSMIKDPYQDIDYLLILHMYSALGSAVEKQLYTETYAYLNELVKPWIISKK